MSNDARLHHVHKLIVVGIETQAVRRGEDFIDDDRRLLARVPRDLAKRGFESDANDVDSGLLVGIGGLEAFEGLDGAK